MKTIGERSPGSPPDGSGCRVKFLLDHDVPDNLSYLLTQLGHEVRLLRKVLPGDSPDEAVLRFAHEAGCILVTSIETIFYISRQPERIVG